MPVFKMAFNGYSVQFSPFDDRLAVGSAQNFGIIGNGKQYVLQVTITALLAPISLTPESQYSQMTLPDRHVMVSEAPDRGA